MSVKRVNLVSQVKMGLQVKRVFPEKMDYPVKMPLSMIPTSGLKTDHAEIPGSLGLLVHRALKVMLAQQVRPVKMGGPVTNVRLDQKEYKGFLVRMVFQEKMVELE